MNQLPLFLIRRLKRRVRRAIRKRRLRLAIEAGLQIGDRCNVSGDVYFGTRPYLVKIGNHVDISREVIFVTHDGADSWMFKDNPERSDLKYYDTIEIKDHCFIGIRAIFLPGVTVGPHSIVGAGSVVTRDVLPNTVVMRNPARPVCTVDMHSQLVRYRSFHYAPELRADRKRSREAIERNLEILRSRRAAAVRTSRTDT
jgi:acetyltransferase-like isoleucine patch superfamily enzyme